MKSNFALTAVIAGLCLIESAPTFAQAPGAPAQHGSFLQHQRVTRDAMKEMSETMAAMTERMSGAELTPEQRRDMARNMDHMSSMMRRMSGFLSQPSMMDAPQSRAEMDQMKKEMDEMRRDPSMRHR
jgi:hypothetical protein